MAVVGVVRWVLFASSALSLVPVVQAHGRTQQAVPPVATPVPAPDPDPDGDTPVVSDETFEKSLPIIDGTIDAPLPPVPDQGLPTDESIVPVPLPQADELAQPLPPLGSFDATPPPVVATTDDEKQTEIGYSVTVNGLDPIGLTSQFRALSALEQGDDKAPNAAIVAARAREDEALAVRLMHSLGYYDGSAVSVIEAVPGDVGRVRATITAIPGSQYRIGAITIDSVATIPADLIDRELALKVGDPIEATRIQGAEANVSLKLPQQGYPFVILGQRDILLDEATLTGAYRLPVDPGPRSSFGGYTTEGDLAFDAEHVGVLARFKRGELYDARKVDDLRQALVATSLFRTVSVEPVRTGEVAPDGTEYVSLLVRQNAGRPRTLAIEGGYGTGQGFRVEGSWTHRNLFPPEGALIGAAVLGTQEQGLSGTFRRSNAGKRDRTLQVIASVNHSNYDAFEAYTTTLSARMSYDSTPIWQKRITWSVGAELVGTNEDVYDFANLTRGRGTYFVGALPMFIGFDTSDDLLNPTRGFRVKANVSPEGSVRGSVRPYGRLMLEGTAYYPIGDSIVIAGRARVGSIPGIERDDLAPSRRYYGGGGGSVRGFGFQELGPKSPDGKPVGGRSLNEFAIEARYRFGNFGIVPFIDAGQVYEGIAPKGSDLRFGAGIGGRFYTNFGPLRVDVATPIARKPGEARVALYISIGQAF